MPVVKWMYKITAMNIESNLLRVWGSMSAVQQVVPIVLYSLQCMVEGLELRVELQRIRDFLVCTLRLVKSSVAIVNSADLYNRTEVPWQRRIRKFPVPWRTRRVLISIQVLLVKLYSNLSKVTITTYHTTLQTMQRARRYSRHRVIQQVQEIS